MKFVVCRECMCTESHISVDSYATSTYGGMWSFRMNWSRIWHVSCSNVVLVCSCLNIAFNSLNTRIFVSVATLQHSISMIWSNMDSTNKSDRNITPSSELSVSAVRWADPSHSRHKIHHNQYGSTSQQTLHAPSCNGSEIHGTNLHCPAA